ncbi:MAG: glutathione synthase [Myxococcota bacterium]
MMALKMLFVADPAETMLVDRDTTFAIMLEAQRRGHQVFEAWIEGLSERNNVPLARVAPVRVQRAERPNHFKREPWAVVPLHDFDVVFMRKDPPVDEAFYYSLLLLERVDRARTQVVNEPRGILAANEKLYALQFKDFTPETLVTRSSADIVQFYRDMGEDIILKPLDGHGGEGVLRVMKGDRNLKSMIEVLTRFGSKWIMAQRYLPAARQGDKRIILVDGKPVGAILRVPPEDDNRGNIHIGATVRKTSLSPREREMCEALGPTLRRDGLTLVGIDVIGEKLTEVNVTSPTGMQEMGRFDGTCPEGILLDVVEARAGR